MACVNGFRHTICLSDDGIAYGFGQNSQGQLGLEHNNKVTVPTPISSLPKIQLVSCGYFFTVCVDEEGFMWSFGENNCGQLGNSNWMNHNSPRKVIDIPPVISVACGGYHTLFITNDDNLWGFGQNKYGQLFLEGGIFAKPTQTCCSNVSRITCGDNISFFQKNGTIFGGGQNGLGQMGTRNENKKHKIAKKLPIIQFCCGYSHSLFLDKIGNVFALGEIIMKI